jgi:hypothetical protein
MTVMIAGSVSHIRDAFKEHDFFQLNWVPDQNLAINGFTHRPSREEADWLRIAPADVLPPSFPLRLSTDNWPFLYLREASIPWFYLRSAFLIGLLGLLLVYILLPKHGVRFHGKMFFLGAGFLLLETKSVVHLALLFGSTWIVNSVVFFSVLAMILGSNLYVLRTRRIKLKWYYAALFICLLVNWLLPLHIFLAGSFMWKHIASTAIVMAPIFFAGVIFARTFAESACPDRDFGSNIAGAVVGGLVEYSSMLLGFRSLLVVAIMFYAVSSFFPTRSR